MSWKLNAFIAIDNWWHHKLKLPGGRWICNRFDAWVMRGPWDDEPIRRPIWRPDQLLGAKFDSQREVSLTIIDWEPVPISGGPTIRTCCTTPANTAHTGICKNSMMSCGEERFLTNE